MARLGAQRSAQRRRSTPSTLCRLLGEPTPAEADPTGETYCFERGERKNTGGDGWADVRKRHHFAWEYKGQRADLAAGRVNVFETT